MVQGAAAMMALVAVAAALSPGAGETVLTEAVPTANPNITKVVGPSEAQWMVWEDAHGLPKECTPAKEITKGPHGEDVITYFADCSMFAKDQAKLQAAREKMRLQSKQGSIALAAADKPTAKAVVTAVVKPALAVHKKAAATTRLSKKHATATSSTADLEPPALPAMLEKPTPTVKKVKTVKTVKTVAKSGFTPAEMKLIKMGEAAKSNKPETIAEKLRQLFFQKKVKMEEARLIAKDDARASALIVDPDADVANGHWGAKLRAKPRNSLMGKLASKATGPAAAILQMVSGSGNLE